MSELLSVPTLALWEKPRGQLPGKQLRRAFAIYKAANKMTKKRKTSKQKSPFALVQNSLSEYLGKQHVCLMSPKL